MDRSHISSSEPHRRLEDSLPDCRELGRWVRRGRGRGDRGGKVRGETLRGVESAAAVVWRKDQSRASLQDLRTSLQFKRVIEGQRDSLFPRYTR